MRRDDCCVEGNILGEEGTRKEKYNEMYVFRKVDRRRKCVEEERGKRKQ